MQPIILFISLLFISIIRWLEAFTTVSLGLIPIGGIISSIISIVDGELLKGIIGIMISLLMISPFIFFNKIENFEKNIRDKYNISTTDNDDGNFIVSVFCIFAALIAYFFYQKEERIVWLIIFSIIILLFIIFSIFLIKSLIKNIKNYKNSIKKSYYEKLLQEKIKSPILYDAIDLFPLIIKIALYRSDVFSTDDLSVFQNEIKEKFGENFVIYSKLAYIYANKMSKNIQNKNNKDKYVEEYLLNIHEGLKKKYPPQKILPNKLLHHGSSNINKTNTIKVSSYERKYPTVSKENNSDTNKKIGDAYELYVGSILTKAGFDVVQYGIENGSRDLGRDIIAYKGNLVWIIQCKCWSSDTRIHENVICQLYGTTKEFEQKSKEEGYNFTVESYLYTTTILTETASDFAFRLNVHIIQQSMNWKFYKE